jgi:hypothetical protein
MQVLEKHLYKLCGFKNLSVSGSKMPMENERPQKRDVCFLMMLLLFSSFSESVFNAFNIENYYNRYISISISEVPSAFYSHWEKAMYDPLSINHRRKLKMANRKHPWVNASKVYKLPQVYA